MEFQFRFEFPPLVGPVGHRAGDHQLFSNGLVVDDEADLRRC